MKKEHLIEGRLAKEGERQLSSYLIFKCKLLLSKQIQPYNNIIFLIKFM